MMDSNSDLMTALVSAKQEELRQSAVLPETRTGGGSKVDGEHAHPRGRTDRRHMPGSCPD